MDLSDVANSLDQVEVSMKDNEERIKELYGKFAEVSAAMATLAVKSKINVKGCDESSST